ncbi:hypothetical protein [Streptomyces sp. G45]|uniref:hypothetical protein n=1 Tax=Streptomyces sp. G45 TaxID=3406627 RepID=UPI003C2A51E6
MRTTRLLAAVGLAGLAALLAPGAALAASGDDDKPTDAGTSFRTATKIAQGHTATANASTGDYLYWSFPADAGQRPTVKATVKLPKAAPSSARWRIDVYDGLRRRQSCMYGMQARTAPQGAGSVELACVLRTVRAWSEPWANDPLPGTYYVRLTATGLKTADLGQPVTAEVEATSKDIGGAAAVDGTLGAPLVPGGTTTEAEPEDGWSSGWWTSRWIWTGVGGALAALAGVGGYTLTRRSPSGARGISSPSGV